MDAIERLKNERAKRSETEIDDVETDIWKGHYSAKSMIGAWLGGILVTAMFPVIVAVGNPNRVAWLTIFILIALMWVVLLGISIYRKLSEQYWLTSQRLKHRNGILFRQSNRLELIDIDDVSYTQGPVQAMAHDCRKSTVAFLDTAH